MQDRALVVRQGLYLEQVPRLALHAPRAIMHRSAVVPVQHVLVARTVRVGLLHAQIVR